MMVKIELKGLEGRKMPKKCYKYNSEYVSFIFMQRTKSVTGWDEMAIERIQFLIGWIDRFM